MRVVSAWEWAGPIGVDGPGRFAADLLKGFEDAQEVVPDLVVGEADRPNAMSFHRLGAGGVVLRLGWLGMAVAVDLEAHSRFGAVVVDDEAAGAGCGSRAAYGAPGCRHGPRRE